jgi:hypothetical protein
MWFVVVRFGCLDFARPIAAGQKKPTDAKYQGSSRGSAIRVVVRWPVQGGGVSPRCPATAVAARAADHTCER